MANTMKIVIEEDGQISIETDEISPTLHKSAEEFLRMCKELAGGTVVEKKLPHSHGSVKNTIKVGR